jgi:hypothetical protein
MNEIERIIDRYDQLDLDTELSTFKGLMQLSRRFYFDMAELYDCFTRLSNTDRNPSGFVANDAAILGLLVRTWKLLKQICRHYQDNDGDMIAQLDRQVVESAVTAIYLMKGDDDRIVDYRRCGYKSRIQTLADAKSDSGFYDTKPGRRLVASIEAKLARDGFDTDSFADQKARRWKVGGKSFRDIFAEVDNHRLYKHVYGMSSESLHGSWADSLDHHLIEAGDAHYKANPFSAPVDIRTVTPLLRWTNPAFRYWLHRIDVIDQELDSIFEWSDDVNQRIFEAFDKLFLPELYGKDDSSDAAGPGLFLQAFIDSELWDRAAWDATGFLTDGLAPPILALRFKDAEIGRRIFEGWRRRLGSRDVYEELRVSLVRDRALGDGSAAPYHVVIASEPEHTAERARDHGVPLDVSNAIVPCRKNTMTPPAGAKNLELFMAAYLRVGSFRLAALDEDGRPTEAASIRKREIRFSEINTLTKGELEYGILHPEETS